MKSVYVDDVLHQKLKRLAVEKQQTLLALLNQLVREGIERLEKTRRHPRGGARDPVGMFGEKSKKKVEIEKRYGANRYQGVEENAGSPTGTD
jgi:hypothetical protein